MAKTVNIIGNHNLNTNSLECLARDLSEVFQCTIHYGYDDLYRYEIKDNKLIEIYRDVNFVELGKVEKKGNKKPLFLTEEGYLKHDLLAKISLLDNFEMNEDIKKMFIEQSFELRDANFDLDISIYKDAIDYDYEYMEWWLFGRQFIVEDEDDYLPYLTKWIEGVRDGMKKYGTTEMFFYCFETKSNMVHDLAYKKHSWNSIKEQTKNTFGDKFLNISEFYKSKGFNNVLKSVNRFPYGQLRKKLEASNEYVDIHKSYNYYGIYFYDGLDLLPLI